MAKKPTSEELLNSNIKELLGTSIGRDVIWHILSFCDVYSSAYNASATDYLTGRQDVGKEIILMLMAADPTLYPNLILTKERENRNERQDDNDS